jgi:hypothetical protein
VWIVGSEQTILTAHAERALRLLSSLSRRPFPRPIAFPSSCEQRGVLQETGAAMTVTIETILRFEEVRELLAGAE